MNQDDNILDDLFHGVALAAFVEEARLSGGEPCPDRTRQLAYQLYEQSLRSKDKTQAQSA